VPGWTRRPVLYLPAAAREAFRAFCGRVAANISNLSLHMRLLAKPSSLNTAHARVAKRAWAKTGSRRAEGGLWRAWRKAAYITRSPQPLSAEVWREERANAFLPSCLRCCRLPTPSPGDNAALCAPNVAGVAPAVRRSGRVFLQCLAAATGGRCWIPVLRQSGGLTRFYLAWRAAALPFLLAAWYRCKRLLPACAFCDAWALNVTTNATQLRI